MQIKNCRLCKSENIEMFLDLGLQPPSDAFIEKYQIHEPRTIYPLQVFLCKDCGLHQIGYNVDPGVLYADGKYPYETGATDYYHKFAKEVFDDKELELKKDDLVIDIGSNIGVLLQGFKNCGMKVLGVDPARNITDIANKNGITSVADFFDGDSNALMNFIFQAHGQASLITATNSFMHIPNLDGVMKGINRLLKKDGYFVFENPWYLETVKQNAFDQHYFEHYNYLTLKPFAKYLFKFGFTVVKVVKSHIHTGSLRVFVKRTTEVEFVDSSFDSILKEESNFGLHTIERMNKFSSDVKNIRDEFVWTLNSIKRSGKSIALMSCPAKSSTLLNYCKIGTEIIDFGTEKSELKIGKLCPGSNIEIFGDNELLNRQPDYVLLGAWNFAKNIISRNMEYIKRGGNVIIPLPHPTIINSNTIKLLGNANELVDTKLGK